MTLCPTPTKPSTTHLWNYQGHYDTILRVLLAYESVQVTPIMVAPINDLLPTIHAYAYHIMVEMETFLRLTQSKDVLTRVLNLSCLPKNCSCVSFLCLYLLYYTLMSFSNLWLQCAGTQSQEYSVGRMLHTTNNYVRIHNVTAKPRHEYHFLFTSEAAS